MTTLGLSEKMEGAAPSGSDVVVDWDGTKSHLYVKGQLNREQRGDHVVLWVKTLTALFHLYSSVCLDAWILGETSDGY